MITIQFIILYNENIENLCNKNPQFHDISIFCLLSDFEHKLRVKLYNIFYYEYLEIKDQFTDEINIIKKYEKIYKKLTIYKDDTTCIICTNQCNKFIKSPCCNNSYGCVDCMRIFKKCLICNKEII